MKRRKQMYTKEICGSSDGQAQGYSDSYEVYQDLEAKNGTKLHYLNKFKNIPTINECGALKIQVFSTRRLRNSCL